jgi:PAS domain S-box-containing protein
MPEGDSGSPYRELFDLATFPDALFDEQGRCLLANRAFIQYFGRSGGGDAPRLPQLSELFERPGSARALIAEIADRRVIRRREAQLVDSDGHLVTMLLSARRLEHLGNAAVELSLADISDRKRLERAWRMDHARLVSLLEGLSGGLVLVDSLGAISGLNQNLEELSGLELGQTYLSFFHRLADLARQPELALQALEAAAAAAAKRPSIQIELRGQGGRRLGLSFFPIWDERGSQSGWGCQVSDLSGRAQRASWNLERLSSLVRQIRPPLAAIQGNAAALQANYRQWDEAMVSGFLEAISRDTALLVGQVDGALASAGPAGRPDALKPEAVGTDEPGGTPTRRSGPTVVSHEADGAESVRCALLLIVQGEAGRPSALESLLRESGYQVECVADSSAAFQELREHPHDLVMIDRPLPRMGEMGLIRSIRRQSTVPILLVTMAMATGDLVEVLDAGADDYVSMPFQPDELLARIRALLRRGEGGLALEADRFQVDGLMVNFDARRAWNDDRELELTPSEFELLERLIRHRGQVLTHSQLARHLWGRESLRSRHDLFVHISRLRKKIEADPKRPHFIVTRWGVGYVFLPR